MNYEDFLFSQLFMNYVDNNDTIYNDTMEYDLIFPKIMQHQKEYKASTYFSMNKSEYECILDYLTNELTIKNTIMSNIDFDTEEQISMLLHMHSEANYKLKTNRYELSKSESFVNYAQMEICMETENKVLLNTMEFIKNELIKLYNR
jgi:hypothetical protein